MKIFACIMEKLRAAGHEISISPFKNISLMKEYKPITCRQICPNVTSCKELNVHASIDHAHPVHVTLEGNHVAERIDYISQKSARG